MNNFFVSALLLCLCSSTLLAQHEQLSEWKTESRQSRLSVDLLQLKEAFQQHRAQRGAAAAFLPPNNAIEYHDGFIHIEVIADGPASELMSIARSIGMTHLYSFQRVLNGRIPISKLDQLSRLPNFISIRPVYAHAAHSGPAQTQGDQAARTDQVRRAFGLDGTGIKVGVLSDSYDYLRGAATGVAEGDLPGPGNPEGRRISVDVLADDGNTDEGRAMLEIIHDIAPGAELAFHTAKGGSAAFARAILDLAEKADCDIIVDDIIYKSSPFFQDGIVAQAVDSVHAMGVTYFTSAGNQGDRSYEATFQEGTTYPISFTDSYGRSYHENLIPHEFAPGDPLQAVRIPYGATLTLALQWPDRYPSISGLPGPQSDLDFFLLTADGKEVLASSANNNTYSDPLELLSYTNNSGAEITANLLIGLVSGPMPKLVKYVSYGSLRADEYFQGASTCIGHANAAGAITVGAAGYHNTPEFGVDDPTLQSFSSEGGTPIFTDFTSEGSLNGIIRNKPDIVAPDGGDNSFFGGDTDGNGYPNFFGTSAAAPHAAGLAALLLQLNGELQPEDIRAALRSTSIDMLSAGFDYRSGWGLIDGFAAVLKEAQYAPKVALKDSDQYLPGKEFSGNGLLNTNMEVSTGFHLTSATAIRLLPGFKTRAGTQFSARIDEQSARERSENSAPQPEEVNLFAVAQSNVFAVSTPTPTESIGLEAYPNPFRQFTTVTVQTEREEPATLRVVNAAGKLIEMLHPAGKLSAGTNTFTFDGRGLPTGLYYLILERSGQTETQAIVKQ